MVELGYFKHRMSPSRMQAEGFPPPYALGPNSIAWDLDECEAWLSTRPRGAYRARHGVTAAPAQRENGRD
jgi:hypothetical protein